MKDISEITEPINNDGEKITDNKQTNGSGRVIIKQM